MQQQCFKKTKTYKSGNKTSKGKSQAGKNAFGGLFALIFVLILGIASWQGYIPIWLGYIYGLMSLVTFISYAKDKRAARKNLWRTSEFYLQMQALFCGWPGALLARQCLRHKSQKFSFSLVLYLMILLNLIILYGVYNIH